MNWKRERPAHPYDFQPAVAEFSLQTPAGADGSTMPVEQRAESHGGQDISPALNWVGAPDGTQGYAVTCYDIDAPTPSGVWHWIVTDIPVSVNYLPPNAGSSVGAGVGGRDLINDLGASGYAGGAPPEGDHEHRYLMTVHALSVPTLPVPEGASTAVATFILGAHTLGRAHTTLIF